MAFSVLRHSCSPSTSSQRSIANTPCAYMCNTHTRKCRLPHGAAPRTLSSTLSTPAKAERMYDATSWHYYILGSILIKQNNHKMNISHLPRMQLAGEVVRHLRLKCVLSARRIPPKRKNLAIYPSTHKNIVVHVCSLKQHTVKELQVKHVTDLHITGALYLGVRLFVFCFLKIWLTSLASYFRTQVSYFIFGKHYFTWMNYWFFRWFNMVILHA